MTDNMGAFAWCELMTRDMDAAADFYSAVTGWEIQDASQNGMRYSLFTHEGKPVAGLMSLPKEACGPGAPIGWFGYIGVDDVDRAAASVTAAGGAVHRAPDDIPDVGRFAVVSDPQGATFALFAPLSTAPGQSDTACGPGQVGWHELYTTDWRAALEFYSWQFGWTAGDGIDMGEMGTYQLFLRNGQPLGGMMTKPPSVPAPVWQYYLVVPAIDAAAERARSNGGQILIEPTPVPGGGWILHGLDPQGAKFALLSANR